MKIGRYLPVLVYFLLALVCISFASKDDEIEEFEEGPTHIVVPRSIRVFSRGPDPEDLIYKGPRISKHLHNVIQGGTVGLEFDVKQGMGRFGPFWDKIRKLLPKYRGDKRPEFVPVDEDKNNGADEAVKDNEVDDNGVSAEILDPVGRGFINPRLKPNAKEEMEWERI